MASHNKVLDLNAIVKAWAMEMFRISKTKEQGKIPQDDLVYRVNWNRAKIIHKEPEYQVGEGHSKWLLNGNKTGR